VTRLNCRCHPLNAGDLAGLEQDFDVFSCFCRAQAHDAQTDKTDLHTDRHATPREQRLQCSLIIIVIIIIIISLMVKVAKASCTVPI